MIDGELVVRALSIVNPVGDVVDETGLTIAGARREGKFMADHASSRRWDKATFDPGNNTILTTVMTNARLDKLQLYYLAERAGNGMVRAVSPVHTSFDGDIVFTLTTQEIEFNIDNLVELSIEAVRKSIVNAVMMARPLAGIPSIKQ